LVIADLYGFLNDALPEQPINAFFAACRMTPLVLLQSGNMPYRWVFWFTAQCAMAGAFSTGKGECGHTRYCLGYSFTLCPDGPTG
ncbi:hypothetical protein MJI46_33695, partial [Salmonella enterica subsp. enterica serovar Cerro]|nr:hypothetical protein [Salmonella enterica subsp. enterica serovar Cerro]